MDKLLVFKDVSQVIRLNVTFNIMRVNIQQIYDLPLRDCLHLQTAKVDYVLRSRSQVYFIK